eukprot:TRINITY_DN2899_c0_g1_i1.p1 TRINITY_DN2899_c0_g1~~TRINITY_DN2899_c0_g1_i1.p1  ORF type:complete len:535 (-),score=169.21 TRINITY_DN2899_c0_g1_i1:23-1627(-)
MTEEWSLEDVLDEISVKLILNQPKEDYTSWERIFFKIEESYWLYIDHYIIQYPYLKKFSGVQEFAKTIINHCPIIEKENFDIELEFNNWNKYRERVPVFGTILLNASKTKTILVNNSFGLWGFPKGKVNKDETELECSLRETTEEVGYDATELADPNLFIDASSSTRKAKFFIIHNVPENTQFQKTTHEEIIDIQWVDLHGGSHKLTRLTSLALSRLRKHLKIQHKNNRFGMRELTPWVGDSKNIGEVLLEGEGSVKNRDQYKDNYEKFGVRSTFDFEDYTVPIDKNLLNGQNGNNNKNNGRNNNNKNNNNNNNIIPNNNKNGYRKNIIVIPEKKFKNNNNNKNNNNIPKNIAVKNSNNEKRIISLSDNKKTESAKKIDPPRKIVIEKKLVAKENKNNNPNKNNQNKTNNKANKNNSNVANNNKNNNGVIDVNVNVHNGNNVNQKVDNPFSEITFSNGFHNEIEFEQPQPPSNVLDFFVQEKPTFFEFNLGNHTIKLPYLDYPSFDLPVQNFQYNPSNLINFKLDIDQVMSSFK